MPAEAIKDSRQNNQVEHHYMNHDPAIPNLTSLAILWFFKRILIVFLWNFEDIYLYSVLVYALLQVDLYGMMLYCCFIATNKI